MPRKSVAEDATEAVAKSGPAPRRSIHVLALCCRDRWGHVSIGVSNEVYAADTIVSFGGFNSEIYFSTVTDQV